MRPARRLVAGLEALVLSLRASGTSLPLLVLYTDAVAQATVDSAQTRYFVVHLHRLLEPPAP